MLARGQGRHAGALADVRRAQLRVAGSLGAGRIEGASSFLELSRRSRALGSLLLVEMIDE
jgi:hypothetical protein